MNTLNVELALAKRYHFQPLGKELSEKYREYFRETIPSFFHKGNDLKLYTIKGNLICDGYERIVIGDYGAFVEFRPDQASDNITCISELTGSYTILDGSEIKIHLQKETVLYADYKPACFMSQCMKHTKNAEFLFLTGSGYVSLDKAIRHGKGKKY